MHATHLRLGEAGRTAGASDLASIEFLGPSGRGVKGAIWVGNQQKTGRFDLIGSGIVSDNTAGATEFDRFRRSGLWKRVDRRVCMWSHGYLLSR
jgi:hypothetical protein